MKRLNNLLPKIYDFENLMLADSKARKGKGNQYGIKIFDRNPHGNLLRLQDMLKNQTYKTSTYTTFKVYEPKERIVYRLPYFPDRIAHHAIMNVLEPIFVSTFTRDTYSCIKGKGIKALGDGIKKALRNPVKTKYCLKIDIKKFYPNIDHETLKQLLRIKIKDRALLSILDGIIDSADGVPIGNYLSQYFANFYLAYFDHWMKEEMGVKNYFRYADDIAVLHESKEYLHYLLSRIREYFAVNLKLEIKDNYQVFPTESRGLDMGGYVFRSRYTRLRKGIKKRFARMMAHSRKLKIEKKQSMEAYKGWAKHGNCIHLVKKLCA